MGNRYPAPPVICPVMLQRWHEISFFHWSCDPAVVQPRLPSGLQPDTFDGKGWVSLTPFLLTGLRPPLIPHALGLVFPEMNLRTYVMGPNGPGIWFFSLDAARIVAVLGARGARLRSMMQAKPHLEDIYIAHLSRNDGSRVADDS